MSTEPRFRATAIFSRNIIKIPNLAAFLPESAELVPVHGRLPKRVDSIAGWGRGPASERARRMAERRNLPYLALEDGFIRSLGPAAAGDPPMSLIVDPVGIHYDATRASALENLLQADDAVLDVEQAIGAIACIRAERLCKVNDAALLGPDELDAGERPLVVVVDQARGDISVETGIGGERQFHEMLDAAIDEHPDAAVLVKLHPEVIAGRKQSYLAERAHRLGVAILDRDVNPISLVERAERVYTVTSQLGMEALICGTPVTCFGMPFYAGWGASDDRLACARRTRRRSVLEIFAAAYLHHARYVDPLTGEAARLGQILERLALMRRTIERNRGHNEGLGFARSKRTLVQPFFNVGAASLSFSQSAGRAVERARENCGRVCVWASHEPDDLKPAAQLSDVPVVRVEDGFLRSVGVGSDLPPGASLVFDRRGIYFDPRGFSELEEILEFEDFDEEVLALAATLRTRLLETGDTKYLGRAATFGFEDDPRRKILIPGQIEDAASVRAGGNGLESTLDLLRAVRQCCPEALIVFKPHPEAETGHRRARLDRHEAERLIDVTLTDASPQAAIAAVDEVHTLTSLLGFEALLRGRKVVTYGGPFYAGWGLTDDRMTFPRRTRRLTIDQLVAGALIRYPTYVDPLTGLPCDVMTVVDRLATGRGELNTTTVRSRRIWETLRRALRGLAQITRRAA